MIIIKNKTELEKYVDKNGNLFFEDSVRFEIQIKWDKSIYCKKNIYSGKGITVREELKVGEWVLTGVNIEKLFQVIDDEVNEFEELMAKQSDEEYSKEGLLKFQKYIAAVKEIEAGVTNDSNKK